MSKINELKGVGNGFGLLIKSFLEQKSIDLNKCLTNKNYQNDIDYFRLVIENELMNIFKRSPIENIKVLTDKSQVLVRQAEQLKKKMPIFSQSKRNFHSTFRLRVDIPKKINLNDLPKFQHKLSLNAKERKVPSSRVSRLINFGNLAAGLGAGALNELAKRAVGLNETKVNESGSLIDETTSVFLTEENVERIVDTLCKVRGAALKLGQMLSIQDEAMLSPKLQKIFERVRQSADFMPFWQTEQVLKASYGDDYMNRFENFEKNPFAAASIGQVHLAELKGTNEKVAVKIQYPGVAQSIQSDIDNLMSIMNVAQLLPKQLYVENVVSVMKRELLDECDYLREANCCDRFSKLVENDSVFKVPKIYFDLTTKDILVAELIDGEPFDKCIGLDQEQRNFIGYHMLRLCLNELFVFNLMQTDPNFSNFFFNKYTNKIHLLDFGATREYSSKFVDKYIRIIRAAADNDRQGIIKWSRELKFLTGFETKIMENAHADAVLILGEAFAQDSVFDFSKQHTTKRINSLVPVMLKYRLTPPPEETYSLHRKMSGAFLLCAKLGAKINCYKLFDDVWKNYKFSDV